MFLSTLINKIMNKKILHYCPLSLEPNPCLISLSLLVITLVLIYLILLLSRFQGKPYPPGPKGWPVLGNIALMKELTHRGLAKLAKQYGGILHLRLGFLHVVVVSSPDMAQQVLQVHDHVFSNRPANNAVNYLTYDRSDFSFAHYGPFWRQVRKLFVMKLFTPKRAKTWDSVPAEVDDMIRAVAAAAGDGIAVNIGEMVFGLTRNITYLAAFGWIGSKGFKDEFTKILLEFSKLFTAFNLADFIPGLGRIDPQGVNRRVVKARAALDGYIDTVIHEHEQKKVKDGNHNSDTDIVDELLAFCTSDNDLHKSSLKLTSTNVKAVIMDVMFGGTETVASAIEWTLSELLRRPRHLKKIQQELTDALTLHRQVEETDFKNLTYLNCCIKEALRLHPPIPVLLHETSENIAVCGYHIPKKTTVMINVWAICHDENTWEDPEEFKPERFLKDGAQDFTGRHFDFIPFGSGWRSCPGMQLGLHTLQMTVARLLHAFNWELPNGMKPSEVNMDEDFGLSATRSQRLVAVPEKRLIY